MDIFIDDNMPREWFFISTPLSEKKSLSFDWTTKGHRMILQRLKGEMPTPKSKPAMEWDTLYIHDGKYIGKEHAQWYDLDKEDWINGQIYEILQEWPLDKSTADKLLRYSLMVRDHKSELEKYAKEMQEFEELVNKFILIAK